MRTGSSTVMAALLGAALWFVYGAHSALAADNYGQPIPTNVATVKLEEIMKHPVAFKDKEVVLVGNYAGHCCATDFNYKEGLNGAECYYPGFNVPKTKPGRAVKVWAIIRVRGDAEAADQKTTESEEKKQSADVATESAPKEQREMEVSIEAKGVEFK